MKRIGLLLLLFAVSKAFAGDPICAKTYATLRKGPGAKFPVSWKVAKYMPFMRLEKKDAWAKVQDLEGETHWAQSRDLTTNLHCAVVKTNVATLRTEPTNGAAASDLKSVDRYTPFKRLEANGEWLQVEDETGRQAWIHESNIWKPVKIQAVDF